jgi:hypothetical protein
VRCRQRDGGTSHIAPQIGASCRCKHNNQTAAGHGSGCSLADSGCALVTWAAPLWLELRPCSLWLAAPLWLGLPLLLQQKVCCGGSGGGGKVGDIAWQRQQQQQQDSNGSGNDAAAVGSRNRQRWQHGSSSNGSNGAAQWRSVMEQAQVGLRPCRLRLRPRDLGCAQVAWAAVIGKVVLRNPVRAMTSHCRLCSQSSSHWCRLVRLIQ